MANRICTNNHCVPPNDSDSQSSPAHSPTDYTPTEPVMDRAPVSFAEDEPEPSGSLLQFLEETVLTFGKTDYSKPGPSKRPRVDSPYPFSFRPVRPESTTPAPPVLKPVCHVNDGTQTDSKVSVGTQTASIPAPMPILNRGVFVPLTDLQIGYVLPQRRSDT
ncbi:uncharacterized protein LOC128540840 [Clarias gariepinus]|uniref:uncharacterized protein LOC128540840 n=1 Tax=Clarias gariepinus TaxID=13013 RepID=UPI00234C7F8E|nr:uncharacterized protein LOC128540840 [Clarias gariepinus]